MLARQMLFFREVNSEHKTLHIHFPPSPWSVVLTWLHYAVPMRAKRKRGDEPLTITKRIKASNPAARGRDIGPITHNVLSFCYREVLPLRLFLSSSLPPTSRARRRKITNHVLESGSDFLDTTLVGISSRARPALEEARHREFIIFTQSQQRPSHSSNGVPEEDRLTEVRFE
jgi:hypothetical protein